MKVNSVKEYIENLNEDGKKYFNELEQILPACKRGKRCINIKYGDDKSFEVTKEKVNEFLENIF